LRVKYQPAVPDSGNRAEPHHHFLAEEKDGEKQDERPEQLHPVVLAHLGVDPDAARVVPRRPWRSGQDPMMTSSHLSFLRQDSELAAPLLESAERTGDIT
jgi:hypothetical protein